MDCEFKGPDDYPTDYLVPTLAGLSGLFIVLGCFVKCKLRQIQRCFQSVDQEEP